MGTLSGMIKKMVNLSPGIKEWSIHLYDRYCHRIYRRYARRYPVDSKTVVFEAFLGSKYACSPKAVYEAMCKDPAYHTYKKVWCFKDPQKYKFLEKDPQTVLVKYRSGEYYKYYAQAGYWITNYLPTYGIEKRKGQVYVQCWHGTPLKKIGCDVQRRGLSAVERARTEGEYEREGRRIDYLPSQSPFYSEKIRSAFRLGPQARILEVGYPRNDALFACEEEKQKKLRDKLRLPGDKKVILYAPTWRDNQHTVGTGYTYELGIDFDRLKDALEQDCIILFRAHYLISNSFDFEKYKGFVRNVSEYDDINDLYLVSDLLVTDYSSVFFDYGNLRRPMLFYMYDYEEYKDQLRDFYFGIEELPGPVIREKRDISGDIMELLREFTYNEKYEAFNRKFNPYSGACSALLLKEIMKE